MIFYGIAQSDGRITRRGQCADDMLAQQALAGETASRLTEAEYYSVKPGNDCSLVNGRLVINIRATIPETPEQAEAAGIVAIDDLAKTLAMNTMTGGFIKAQMYEEQSREVVLFQSIKGTVLTLTSATAQFPALMAMVAVWNPEATTAAAKLAALSAMVAKVDAGIAKSRPYLRKLNAIAVFGKEQLRATTTVAAKRAVIDATTAKLSSTTA